MENPVSAKEIAREHGREIWWDFLPGDKAKQVTFRRIFIVLDKQDWEIDGVLTICRQQSVAEHGLGEEKEEGKFMDEKWMAYRKGLSEAIKGVICDPESRKSAAPVMEA